MIRVLTAALTAFLMIATGCESPSDSSGQERAESAASTAQTEQTPESDRSQFIEGGDSAEPLSKRLQLAQESVAKWRRKLTSFGTFNFKKSPPHWEELGRADRELLADFWVPGSADFIGFLTGTYESHLTGSYFSHENFEGQYYCSDFVSSYCSKWKQVPDGRLNPGGDYEAGDVELLLIKGSNLNALREKVFPNLPENASLKWAMLVKIYGQDGKLIHRLIENRVRLPKDQDLSREGLRVPGRSEGNKDN